MVYGGPQGIDLVLEGRPRLWDFEFLAYRARCHWPQSVVEIAEGWIFIYRDEKARQAWAEDGGIAENQDSLIHIIRSDHCLTVVCGEGLESVAQGWLDEVKEGRDAPGTVETPEKS